MSDLEKRVEALRTQVNAMGGGAKIFQEWLVKKLDALLVLPEAPDHMEIPDPPAIPTRTILHVGGEEHELSQAPREEEPGLREALEESNAAIVEYLEWGPMTSSDRDYHARNLKRVVEFARGALAARPVEAKETPPCAAPGRVND